MVRGKTVRSPTVGSAAVNVRTPAIRSEPGHMPRHMAIRDVQAQQQRAEERLQPSSGPLSSLPGCRSLPSRHLGPAAARWGKRGRKQSRAKAFLSFATAVDTVILDTVVSSRRGEWPPDPPVSCLDRQQRHHLFSTARVCKRVAPSIPRGRSTTATWRPGGLTGVPLASPRAHSRLTPYSCHLVGRENNGRKKRLCQACPSRRAGSQSNEALVKLDSFIFSVESTQDQYE